MTPHRASLACLLTAGLAFAFSPSPAAAQEDRPLSFELFGAYDHRDGVGDEAAGARAGFRLTDRWGIEGTLSRLSDDGVEVWMADLSGKLYLGNAGRAGLFLLAGPGGIRVDGFEELTFHAGLGAEVPLGERVYLRPDVPPACGIGPTARPASPASSWPCAGRPA